MLPGRNDAEISVQTRCTIRRYTASVVKILIFQIILNANAELDFKRVSLNHATSVILNANAFSIWLGSGIENAKQKVRLNSNQRAIQPLANICWTPISVHAAILIRGLKS